MSASVAVRRRHDLLDCSAGEEVCSCWSGQASTRTGAPLAASLRPRAMGLSAIAAGDSRLGAAFAPFGCAPCGSCSVGLPCPAGCASQLCGVAVRDAIVAACVGSAVHPAAAAGRLKRCACDGAGDAPTARRSGRREMSGAQYSKIHYSGPCIALLLSRSMAASTAWLLQTRFTILCARCRREPLPCPTRSHALLVQTDRAAIGPGGASAADSA